MMMARVRLLTLVAGIALAALAAPAMAVELELFGVQLGSTSDDLLASRAYGQPDVMFLPGNQFNPIKDTRTAGAIPAYVSAVQMASVGADQLQWIYNRDPLAVGFLLTRSKNKMIVTNIVVSEWRVFQPTNRVATSLGIHLGDTFAKVLNTYGWPNRLEIISETGSGGGGGVAAPSSGGGREDREDRLIMLTQSRGTGLPAVGPTPAPVAASTTGALTASANGVSFSKACLLSYPTVDFLLYRMRVFRIHIYRRAPGAAAAATGAPAAIAPAYVAPTAAQPGLPTFGPSRRESKDER